MPLTDLPDELLRWILEYLQYDDRNLSALKLTNKHLHTLAYRVASREFSCTTDDSEQLKTDLTEWLSKLRRYDCVSAVQELYLSVRGDCLPGGVLDHNSWHSDRLVRYRYKGDTCPALTIGTDDPCWDVLADVVRQLSGLKLLSCGCKHQLTPHVIRSLAPSTRLTIESFYHDDLHDEMILTSPSLHTIHIPYDARSSDTEITIARLAPSLRNLCMHRSISEMPHGPLSGKKSQLMALTSLKLTGLQPIDELSCWKGTIDWTLLEALDLGWLSDAAFRSLMTIELPSLRELCLYIVKSACCVNWLTQLPQLESLEFRGDATSLEAKAVTDRHGPTLQTLILSGAHEIVYTKDELLELVRQVPNMVTLEINVLRSADEDVMWKALGSLRHLQDLALFFSIDNRFYEPPAPRTSIREIPGISFSKLDMRRALSEAAVDQSLALHIFEMIVNNHKGMILQSLWIAPGDWIQPRARGLPDALRRRLASLGALYHFLRQPDMSLDLHRRNRVIMENDEWDLPTLRRNGLSWFKKEFIQVWPESAGHVHWWRHARSDKRNLAALV